MGAGVLEHPEDHDHATDVLSDHSGDTDDRREIRVLAGDAGVSERSVSEALELPIQSLGGQAPGEDRQNSNPGLLLPAAERLRCERRGGDP